MVSDFVLETNQRYFINDKKISKINRGSGCIHSAALLYAIVKIKILRNH